MNGVGMNAVEKTSCSFMGFFDAVLRPFSVRAALLSPLSISLFLLPPSSGRVGSLKVEGCWDIGPHHVLRFRGLTLPKAKHD